MFVDGIVLVDIDVEDVEFSGNSEAVVVVVDLVVDLFIFRFTYRILFSRFMS